MVETDGGMAEAASEVSGYVGLYWPPALAIGGILAGIAGTAKRMKPKIEEAESEAVLYGATLEEIVIGIEQFKTVYPESWDKLKNKLNMDKASKSIVDIIRGKR